MLQSKVTRSCGPPHIIVVGVVGNLLKAVKPITKLDNSELSDLDEGLHCFHSEPFFITISKAHSNYIIST